MKVLAVESVGRARLDPRDAGERLARGTVAMAAGMVGDALVGAPVALLAMPAEDGGTAAGSRSRGLAVAHTFVVAIR